METYQYIPQQLSKPLRLKQEYPIYPIIGLLGTICGTLLAIFLMPEDISKDGALFPSAVIMTIGIAIAPIVAALSSPKTLLRAEHILALSPIYWLLLDLLQQAYTIDNFLREGAKGAFFGIGLFISGIWISSLMTTWRLPKILVNSARYQLETKTLFKLIIIFFSLGIFRYAFSCGFNPLVMVESLALGRWSAPWARGSLGGWDAFIYHMMYFGYLLPTLTALLISRSRQINYQIITSILLTIIIVIFLAQEGNRRVIGVIFGAAIICWILEQQKFKIKHLIVSLISVVMLLYGMQIMLEYRNSGFEALLANQKPESTSQYNYLHVDDNFLRLTQSITIIPRYHPYVYEKQLIFVLIRPIPRILWHEKPMNAGFDLAQFIGAQGVAFTHSIIGDLYISFGWTAVFFGSLFYGRLAKMLSGLLIQDTESASPVVYSLALMALFAEMRAIGELVLMSYTLLAWMIISWLFLQKKRRV